MTADGPPGHLLLASVATALSWWPGLSLCPPTVLSARLLPAFFLWFRSPLSPDSTLHPRSPGNLWALPGHVPWAVARVPPVGSMEVHTSSLDPPLWALPGFQCLNSKVPHSL